MRFLTKIKTFTCIIGCILIAGCSTSEKKQESAPAGPLFSLVSPDSSGIDFNNVLTETEKINPVNYPYVYNGSGVAAGDFNKDGLQDLFFSANMSSCKLYLNKGNFHFEDITAKAGVATDNKWCTGVTVSDVNADGWPDIYVCCAGKFALAETRANLLYINNGNLTFTEKAVEYGLDDKGYSGMSTFFDYDLDGDLDVFVMNQPVDINFTITPMEQHNSQINEYNSGKLYRNNGQNKFEDVSKQAGVESNAFSLSCTVADINLDGWPDLYVCNDYMMSDFMYINNKRGGFTDENKKCMAHNSYFAMGADIADFNNDGLPDLVQADMLPEDNYRQKMLLGPNNYDRYFFMLSKNYGQQFMQNCLQLNNGNGTFSDVGAFAGIEKTDWSWAALFADFDNDGWKDIFFDNGYLRDFTNLDYIMYRSEIVRKNKGKLPNTLDVVKSIPATPTQNYLYRNNGDLTFRKMSDEWGLTVKAFSNGAVYADLDNDGDLDLVTNNMNSIAEVYENHSDQRKGNNYIVCQLKGSEKNTGGIGARIIIYTGGNMQVAEAVPVRGFNSAVDSRVHFGLGTSNVIDSLLIRWPDGRVQRLEKIKSNSQLTLSYADAKPGNGDGLNYAKPAATTLLTAIKTGADFRHDENEFIDYKREPLLPQLYSRMGPALASGDVNKDGLDDFYVGGAAGQAGCLYLQTSTGKFSKSPQDAFASDKSHEDTGALLFDADGDGDPDLYVVSGGSEVTGYAPYYQDRLYLNDGKGSFRSAPQALPEINSSGSCVTAMDYDGDGDPDLFRGGRLSPGNYPFHPRSYLLRNDGGKFTDVTEKSAPGLAYTGMVTASCWMDYNNDKAPDLLVTGEWMPLKVFRNNKGVFKEETSAAGTDYTNGWWNSLTSADFDGDGDQDLVAGNLGTNTRIKADANRPACVYAGDFDANGSTDAIICHMFSDSAVYPMYSRDELIDQIRPLRKTLLKYTDYAGKTVEQLFKPEQTKNVFIEKAYTFLSSYFENKGNGTFEMKPLPPFAQMSQVNAAIAGDFNKDGKQDVLLAGNNFSITPSQGRLDGGTGLLLTGDGKGKFTPVSIQSSGFFANGEVRAMVMLKGSSKEQVIVVGNNNDTLQFFKSAR